VEPRRKPAKHLYHHGTNRSRPSVGGAPDVSSRSWALIRHTSPSTDASEPLSSPSFESGASTLNALVVAAVVSVDAVAMLFAQRVDRSLTCSSLCIFLRRLHRTHHDGGGSRLGKSHCTRSCPPICADAVRCSRQDVHRHHGAPRRINSLRDVTTRRLRTLARPAITSSCLLNAFVSAHRWRHRWRRHYATRTTVWGD